MKKTKPYAIFKKPGWLKRLFFAYCPRCWNELEYDEGWDKMKPCTNCKFNINNMEMKDEI